MKKQILLIGAGAVGLVYGKKLVDGGCEVTFYIKEKYLESMSGGSVLYNLNQDKHLRKPIRFKEYSLITSFAELGSKAWDQIYLCFSSTALHSFDFGRFKENLKGDPTIVMLQPGTEDFEVVSKVFPADQIVEGMITLISYAAPMVTESADEPGVAYYFPPFMPTPFSGAMNRKQDVIRTFKQSKIRAGSTKSVQLDALFPSAFLGTFLTALEASEWNFKLMGKNKPLLADLERSINEVFSGLELKFKKKRPFLFHLISKPFAIKLLLKLAPVVMPMDIETYFEAHFTKVNSQTKMYMKEYIEIAKSEGSDHSTIEKLLRQSMA